MNKTDAQDYRNAAELIFRGKQEFTCLALENGKSSAWLSGVGRPDLVKPFKEIFRPSEKRYHYVFWDESVRPNSPRKTNSRKHSRECRIFALLLMAEMVENP
jgi:hypothetical protein